MTITIAHLDGPLKGETDTFGDTDGTVVFGRDPEKAQVVYPPQFDVVGRSHFGLRRMPSGDYTVELFGHRYVEMDGKPVDNGTQVKSGSTFRLGRKDGPTFTVKIAAPAGNDFAVTGDQSGMTTSVGRLRRYGAIASVAIVAAFVGTYTYVLSIESGIEDRIANEFDQAALAASDSFSPATLRKLDNAVYLVARMKDGKPEPQGTAWAFFAGDPAAGVPAKLATNAHVTNEIKGREHEFVLIGPDGEEIAIQAVISHPGYAAFKSYKDTLGTERWDNFKPLDLSTQYDVGIIELDPSVTLPVTLELAGQAALEALEPGTPVASIGFPVRGLVGGDTVMHGPPTLQFGHISSLSDVFMVSTEPAHRLLIRHSVPVTGGASGSPLVNKTGEVIGIVNGGNVTVHKDKSDSLNNSTAVPNAALINFAQRADLLRHLHEGTAGEALAEEQAHWEDQSEKFDTYFDVAIVEFEKLAKRRYGVSEPETEMLADATLDPGEAASAQHISTTYVFEAKPGMVYGFIADADSGVPVSINIEDKETSEFLRDDKDTRKTSPRELAPTAWLRVRRPTFIEVIVWSLVVAPADYRLYAYEWPDPNAAELSPATTAGSGS